MKILLLNAFYPPHVGGGAEVMLRHLAEGLQRRGCEVAVLATGPDAGLHSQTQNQVRVYRAGLANFYWHYTQQRPSRLARLGWHYRDRYNGEMRRHVRDVIQREQPDIVVSNNLTGWSISAWDEISAAGLPIVQVLHDLYLLCPKDTMFNHGRSCQRQCGLCSTFRLGHARASTQVSTVIGVSRFILERITAQGYFSRARQHVVHNCTPAETGMGSRLKSRSGHPLRFGYIGTLSENKGVGWLITQFQRLGIDARLDIAGRGKLDYEARLKAMADPAKVSFLGYCDRDEFMQSIDVLVVPSLWAEPFGLVAVEGCANQLPVIASDMGGLPEIIRDRHNGLLCSPDDPDSLGIAMLWLYIDGTLRQRLASQARASVLPLLDMERMLDRYQSILHETLQGTRIHHEPEPADHPATTRLESVGLRQADPVDAGRRLAAAD
ncbi:glycosyltransferase family 4 protein [Stutzerimonas frequens]|uniref:glycosyltransferase family 4 protein n=1 Tax=Stutzerimonas frequens TaxID=2968969 RepID=UPI00190D9DB4|nr:glycosyltransferase family 4 protein [Stutzerimonas frequens]MBK3757419.1 glycosyltransferase [Stutzerimonas frequens]MBK3872031.1 glycosyltransferase [Stutzerimonas frequens]MBK3910366.1 glycosyltransferase [Stutzerimonas frequens]MBK3928065.1 glycosyltransferase [Stutzerimonas frequens]